MKDIEKRIILNSRKHKNSKPKENNIEAIFYRDGTLAFSKCDDEDFIYLYKEQLEKLKQILQEKKNGE